MYELYLQLKNKLDAKEELVTLLSWSIKFNEVKS